MLVRLRLADQLLGPEKVIVNGGGIAPAAILNSVLDKCTGQHVLDAGAWYDPRQKRGLRSRSAPLTESARY